MLAPYGSGRHTYAYAHTEGSSLSMSVRMLRILRKPSCSDARRVHVSVLRGRESARA